MTTLGFVGLGTMGSAMAGRLVDAGHNVTVWNRSVKAATPLVERGATLAGTAAQALDADISFSMLANDEAALATLSADALGGRGGRIHVNMASISARAAEVLTDRAAQVGVGYVSAPVLGRPAVAAAGNLNIMPAGPTDAVAAVTEYLTILGARLWPMGETPSVANGVKIAVNYNIIHAIQALGESIALVERQGVDPSEFVELLGSTLFGGVVYQGYGSIIAEQRYRPAGFTVELGLKDLVLAEELAQDLDLVMPSAPVLHTAFATAVADPELAGADWSAVAEVTRRS